MLTDKSSLILFILLVVIAIMAIYHIYLQEEYNLSSMTVKSTINNKNYRVKNTSNISDAQNAANILSIVDGRILILRNYLLKNIDKYPEFKSYNIQFCDRISKVRISENTSTNPEYTSYTVNKGDAIALCLRSKKDNKLHDLNLIMYVVLHELAHVACPEIDHTPLFDKIFAFYIQIAIMLKIYKKENYRENPREYCGIPIGKNKKP